MSETKYQIDRTRKTMERWRKGMLTDKETDLLNMIILAHHLKNTAHPEAEGIIEEVLDFMMEMDAHAPLHYSFWLAAAPLTAERPLDFFKAHCVKAVQADYDPFTALNCIFHGSPFDDVSFPVSVYSDQLKEDVEECLGRNDEFALSLRKWMEYENELIRKAKSFPVQDVRSFRFEFRTSLLNKDQALSFAENAQCVLKYKDEDGEEIKSPVRITYRYEDMSAALSLTKPLNLYLIDHASGAVCRYALSPSEYLGFHVGMFILERYDGKDDGEVNCVLVDPKGKRYVLSGTAEAKSSPRTIRSELLFPDGIRRKADLYPEAVHPFALMELNQGYSDLLEQS